MLLQACMSPLAPCNLPPAIMPFLVACNLPAIMPPLAVIFRHLVANTHLLNAMNAEWFTALFFVSGFVAASLRPSRQRCPPPTASTLPPHINRQQSTRSHLTPNQLWVPGYNPPAARAAPSPEQRRPSGWLRDDMTTQQRLEYGQDYQIWRARKMLAQGRSPTLFQVGNLVRINLVAL
jgi:hypothetical protein